MWSSASSAGFHRAPSSDRDSRSRHPTEFPVAVIDRPSTLPVEWRGAADDLLAVPLVTIDPVYARRPRRCGMGGPE